MASSRSEATLCGPPGTYTASKSTEPTVARLMSTGTVPPRAPLSAPSRGPITLGNPPAAARSALLRAPWGPAEPGTDPLGHRARGGEEPAHRRHRGIVHTVGGEYGHLPCLGGVFHGIGHAEGGGGPRRRLGAPRLIGLGVAVGGHAQVERAVPALGAHPQPLAHA